MIYVVHCGTKFYYVDQDETNPPENGDRFECPNNCPYRNRVSCQKLGGSFNIIKTAKTDKTVDSASNIIPYYYSFEKKMWVVGKKQEKNEDSTFLDSELLFGGSNAENSNDDLSEDGLIDIFNDAPQSSDSKKNDLLRGFQQFKKSTPKDSEQNVLCLIDKEDIFANILCDRDFFQIGTTIYSDNFRKYRNSKPLKLALADIFYHWRTGLVFNNKNSNQLTNEFKWLLVNSQGKNQGLSAEDKDIIAHILEDKLLNIDQKFFYIFYCVVNKKNSEIGFYYKSNITGEILTEYFRTKAKFAQAIFSSDMSGDAVKKLLEKNQRELLHFLGYLKYEENMDNEQIGEKIIQKEKELLHDLVIEIARDHNQVVYIERETDKISIYNFGTVINFCENMQHPTELHEMRAKCKFLKKFKIDSKYNVGIYRKNEELTFEEICFDNAKYKKPSNEVYDLLGFKNSSIHLTEYGCYISLLKEYIRVFNPKVVNLPNDIVLRRDDFFKNIKEITRETVMYSLAKEKNEYSKKAIIIGCFVKNLIDNNVLDKFIKATQNNNLENIIELLGMVTENKKAKDVIKKYIDTYKDEATFIIDSYEDTIGEHIDNLSIHSVRDVLNMLENDNILKTYMEIQFDNHKSEISKIRDEIKKLEAKAMNDWK